MSSPRDTYTVGPGVADVRLDNCDDLCRQLGLEPALHAQQADSTILRAAWMQWGVDCVQHLLGDFAFAIWSEVERTLFCARDPLGVRPLCYATLGPAVAVSSMPKGLLALPGFPRELDEVRLAEHLALLPQDGGRTFFRGVSLLPPGHTLRVTPERLEVAAYWQPRRTEVRFRRDEDYVERFRELFDAAVHCRLRSAGPIATTLSAGLDSGSVTAVAARQLAQRGERLPALTCIPRPGACIPQDASRLTDESHHAAAVAALYPNVDHVLVDAPDVSPLALLPAFDAGADQPLLNPIGLPMFYAMEKRLATLRCKVLLTGSMGNITISYDWLTALPTLLRRGRVLRGIRETMALVKTPGWTSRRALHTAVGPLLPVPVLKSLYRLCRHHPISSLSDYSAINPDFARAIDLSVIATRLGWNLELRPLTDGWRMRTTGLSRLDMGMALKGTHAAFGAELRDPTVDLRIVEYCLGIPEEQFLRSGRTRWLVRRAMVGTLPSVVLHEHRRGLQGSDWPRFITANWGAFAAELAELEYSPLARKILDLPELHRLVAAQPAEWVARDMNTYAVKMLRGLATGGFILRFGSPAQSGR